MFSLWKSNQNNQEEESMGEWSGVSLKYEFTVKLFHFTFIQPYLIQHTF